MRAWVTISRGVALMREAGLEGSRRTLARRLAVMDRESSGTLLRWVGAAKRGGKREVCVAVLMRVLGDDSHAAGNDLTRRVATLETRLSGTRSKLITHRKRLDEQEKRLDKQASVLRLHNESLGIIASGI